MKSLQPSAELFRSLIDKAKDFKEFINTEKNQTELTKDKLLERQLFQDEESARENRKEFLK